MTDSFCALMVKGISITPDGVLSPCCRFGGTVEGSAATLKDDFHSPSLTSLREKMLAGERLPQCRKCYDEEDAGSRSLRQKSNDKLGTSPEVVLAHIDLAISNTCNLKCRFCSPIFSSSIATDLKRLGRHDGATIFKSGFDPNSVDLSALRVLEILGGEPLLEQETLCATLQAILDAHSDPQSVEIGITTNLTFRATPKLLDLLNRFKKTSIWFSIDAVGPLNDFIRRGSSFFRVVENLDHFVLRLPNASFFVNTAVNVYNVHLLPDLVQFVREHNPRLKHRLHFVHDPSWMAAWVLPDFERHALADAYETSGETILHPVAKQLRVRTGDFDTFLANTENDDVLASANPKLHAIMEEYRNRT